METRKFWCHYIGRDDKPKRNNQELFNLTELFHDINNTDCKTPLWYEISGEYYLLYAQLSDKVAVLTREGSLYSRHLERMLRNDKQIEDYCQDERWANSEKQFRDYWLNIVKQRQNYCDLLLEGNTWIDAAHIRAFEEVKSPLLPVFQELRRQKLAEREAEYRKELEEHRKAAEEEARKKAEAERKEQERLTQEAEKFRAGESISGEDVVELCRRYGIAIHLRTVHNLQQVICNINGKHGTCQYYRQSKGKRRPQLDGCYKTAGELYQYLQTH